MGKLVDFEGYGLAEYPDDFTDAQIHDSWERNIKPILDAKKRVVLRENAAIANRNAEAANAVSPLWEGTKAAARALPDLGISALKGAIGLPESIVGLADIPTLGYAGKGMDALGFDFKKSKEWLDQYISPAQREANQRVSEAKGFLPTLEESIKNPGTIVQTLVESAPSMLGGAALARKGLQLVSKVGPKAAAWAAGAAVPGSSVPLIAGAVGEGAIAAGSTAEGIRQQTENRLLTWEQAGLSLASGALTGAIGIASGKMAKRLGIDDLDTFLVSGIPAGTAKRTLTERIARGFGGALTEGVMEEMPQSAQEQVANNLALKKPWNEGVAEAAAKGLLAGAVMGGAMGVVMPGGQSATPPPIPPPATPPVQPPPIGSPQAPPALPGKGPVPVPPLPSLSNQTLATPIQSWQSAPYQPHLLAQSPDSFGVGNSVVKLSQSGGGFGKTGVVTAVTGPLVDGNPNSTVTVKFDDGTVQVSGFKEFGFAEHFAQATAIKAGPLWTPPPPRAGTAPQPIPTNTNQQRRTPLDAPAPVPQQVGLPVKPEGTPPVGQAKPKAGTRNRLTSPAAGQATAEAKPVDVGAEWSAEVDTADRKTFVIKGSRGETAARVDLMLDGNGVWRPVPNSGIEILSKSLRGKGLVQKFLTKFSQDVGPVGSTGLTSEEGTSLDAQKMWKRMGVPIEDLPNTDPAIGGKRAYVIRAKKAKPTDVAKPTPAAVPELPSYLAKLVAQAQAATQISAILTQTRGAKSAQDQNPYALTPEQQAKLDEAKAFAAKSGLAWVDVEQQANSQMKGNPEHEAMLKVVVEFERELETRNKRVKPEINDRVFTEDYTGPRWTYGLRNRPMGIGAQPKGFIIGSDGPPAGRARNGTIQYPRELTKDELYSFEMELVSGPETTVKGKRPSATEYERIEREISAALKNPLFREQTKAGTDFRDAFRDLETEAEFHKPAAIAKAQAEIDARKAAKPTPAATGATAQKMPWEMTRAEYQKTEPKSDGVRESLVADLGHSKVRVIKNPTPEDYQRFASEHNRQFPNDTSGDPKTRFTVDSNGNRYVWPAGDAAHSSLEGWLKERGITANQNTQFFSHKYHIFKALREGKPVPESVLADYKGEKWADDALAKLKPPAAKPQPAAEQPKFKPNDKVMVRLRSNHPKEHPGTVYKVVDDETIMVNYKPPGKVDSVTVTVPVAQVNWPQSVLNKRAKDAEFDGMTEEEASKVKRDAKAFRALVHGEEGNKFGWYDLMNEGPTGNLQEGLAKADRKRAATERAFRALKVDGDERSQVAQAAALPILIDYIIKNTPLAERQTAAWWQAVGYERADKQKVSEEDIFDQTTLVVEGQEVVPDGRDEDGNLLLKDGDKFGTQKLAPGDSIFVDKVIQPEPVANDEANFRGILAQAADSSSKLRPQDVERVMSEAGWDSDAFKAWLLKQPLSDDTRKAVEQWGKEEQTLTAEQQVSKQPLLDRLAVVGRILDGNVGRKADRSLFEKEQQNLLHELNSLDAAPEGWSLSGNVWVKNDFSLAPAESVEEQKARLAAEALKGEADAAAKAKADALTNAINKPLTGTVGDIAQDDMLDPQGGLFNNSNPLGNQPAPPAQPLAPLSPTEEDAARMDAIKKLLAAKLKQGPTYMGSLAPGGLDPEFFKLGTELGYLYIKSGVRKFSDFAARLINDLGEKAKPYLLSWYSNAKLTLTSIANELDSESKAQQYYQDTFERPVQGGRVNTGAVTGSGVAGGRPGVRVARQELIPVPRQYVDAGAYSAASGFQLDEEQVRGVNLMVDRFKSVPTGAFLLADGTGFGKTAQLLAVADQYSKQGLGNKILIVTKNKTIADIRFAGDAKRMGIDPKSYTITTYSGLKNIESKGWDLVLFDEAHELKNSEAAKSIAGGRLQAKHKVFATATPMDTFTGAAYFLSEITGEDETQIATKLGYKLVERTDPYSKGVFMAAVLLPESTAKTVWQNIMAYRDAAVANGSMIRREYPFFGKVEDVDVSMDRVSEAEQKELVQYYDDLIDSVSSPTAKRNYAGQKTLSLRRWSEQAKIGPAIQMALDHIAGGGKAIVVAETDKQQRFPVQVRGSKWGKDKSGIEGWLVPGAITQMMELLEKAGVYDVSHIHDPKSNNISSEVDKFQRGPNRLALATPQSGGTGIDLDDSIGGQARLMISLSKNLAGDTFQQLVGRVSRKNTVTPSTVRFLNLLGSFADERSKNILDKKVKTLLAIQGGEELDAAAKPDDTDIIQPGQQQPPYKPSPNKPASTAPPRLDWNPYTTQKGKQKFVAKVTPEFTAWYKSNGENRNSFGIFISDRDGRAWSDANPNETALQSRTGSKPFYSRLNRAVEETPMQNATGFKWKGVINKWSQGTPTPTLGKSWLKGINRDEIDLVGINDLENGKTYSKQEVLDYLRANEVVVKDVTLGAPTGTVLPKILSDAGFVIDRGELSRDGQMTGGQALPPAMREAWNNFKEKPTEFSQPNLQLPGAKEGSYREVLLTVPGFTRQQTFEEYLEASGFRAATGVIASQETSGRVIDERVEKLRDKYLKEYEAGQNRKPVSEWDDGHSQYRDIANPIVRLRFNERTTADGKRMLFLEEVQAPQKAEFEKMPALFQKNWREIAFKWALRKAVEGGYDSLGWTTGAQQADRYSLAKQLDSLKVLDASAKGRTGFDVTGYKDGKAVVVKSNVPLERLESEIGKDLARKVSEDYAGTTGNFNKTYSGLDLEIGGEGLKKLYDTDFRNVINNLPAVKKAGQKVGMAEIQGTNPGVAEKGFTITQSRSGSSWTIRKITQDPAYVGDGSGGIVGDVVKSGFSSRQEAARWADENIKIPAVSIHSLDLAPAIRESVMGGQALFRRSGTATGLPASAVEAHLAQAYGSVPNGVIRVVERPDLNFDGQVILDAATGEFLRIEINASKLNSLDDIDKILTHEFSHIVFRDEGVQSIIGSLTDQERAQIEADMTRLGYTPDSLQEEGGARGIEQLANAWRGRNWFTQVVGRVLAWASEHGLKMTRLAAEMIAARAVAKVKAEVFMADEASIQQVSMGSELALQSRVVPDNAADLEIATAGQQVAAQVESIYASYEAGAQSLSQLALEKKEFRQARAELNKLTSLASARMTQLPNPAPGMTPDPMEGISVQANQVVVGPEFSDKLTNLGVAHNAADAQAKQGAIFFERVADGVTTARERLKDLEAKRNRYISIKAPAADIAQVENTINSNRAQIATLEQTEHDGVTAGQRADEIAAAESNKIDAEGKRDALKLAPVDDYFGGRMANLRELTEKAQASAALARALMAGTTDPAELARLTAEFERFDKMPETARDALVAGKMTDAQLSSVVIALQHSFVEFDLAKANMDDLLLAEQTRILKDIAQAEKDYKAALGANLDTEAVVDAALRSARGSAGLVGSVSGAAKIDQLLLETAAISGMAQTLGQNIEQNRWLYDYLSGVRSTPGGILAFSKANADALGIGEDTLRKLVNAVQSSPALGSALVTLADHAAATRANNYALSLATTVPSISSLAAQAQASTVPSNAQALLNQANAAAATLASAVKPGVRATSKTAQLMSSSINQSLTQLAAVNNGASLFNQVANNPAFVAMRQNANGLNGLVINMIEPGPAKTTFLGFGTTSTVYHPELVINVDDDPANSHRTQGHIYQWSEAAKRYRDDFDAAELAHRANPAANPTPESLGFDRAKVIGLRTALEKQVNGSFLEVSLMDEAARTSIPKVVRKMLKRSWFRQHDFVARLVGGIYGTDLRATQGRWIRGHLNARRVAARFQDMPDLQASAMASHGIKNISTYRSQIWNQMGGYGREFGSRLKVGFTLPVSGQTITKEDMVFFKRTIDFEEQLRRFVTEVDNTRGVREKIGGQTFVRGGGSVGDYGMPRHLGRNATAFIADIISSYLNTKGFTVSSDLSAASTEAVPAFWNKRVDMLKQHLLDSTRTDRAMRQDPTMRKAEMAIANRWLSGAVDPVSSLQDLAQLLAAELVTVPGINPMDYAVRHLNSELIQYHEHAVRIKAEREDPSTRNSGLSIALSSDNEFTKPAAKLELPHSLYDYGALTTGERISAQSRANHEMLVEYANALRRAIGDLKNRINRFDNNQISEAEAARSYGGGMEELRDTFEILSASLVDFEAGYKLGADPALSPSALASELARFPVAGVLALPTVSIRNLTGGQLVVYLMERAMGYTGARLAMYNAIKNAPKALAKASYASALNIARFLDKNLLKTNKKQLEDIVDIIAKVALSPVLLALKNPTTIIAGVKSDLDQVQKLGYDTKMGFVDAFRQAWKESGLYANREEEEAALRSPTATKIGRVTLTAAKGINAFLGAVGVENSDQVLNSVNLVQSQMMETRLGEVAMKFGARLESLGITSIDPTDRRSILLAAEWSPFLNAQASLDSLGQLRLFLEGSAASEGFQLENALLKFYQETKAGKPTHIFSAAQFEAVQRGLLAQMNTSLPTNRASVAAGNRMWRILLTLQGYPSDAFLKLINTAVGGTRNRTVAAQAASKLPLLIGIAMMAIIIGGMSDGASEYWKRKMQGIPSQNAGVLDRDFWQNKDKFMSGAGRFLAANMFYLGDVILGMQNQIQGNRGFDPASRVFPISLAQAFASSIQATFATYQGAGDMSDVATPMVDFFAKLTPGGMEIRNWFGDDRTLRRSKSVTSAEARAAGMELPKQGGQRSAGPTTIVKRNLESAVGAMEEARVSGDTEAYAKAEGQARAEMAKLENYYIKRETERGKSPEEAAKEAKAAVWRDYQEINPVSSALGGRRPTASEYQTITTGATGARAITQQAGISAWQQGANALFNKTGTVTRETASASSGGGGGGGSGGGYGATMTASSGVGRATSGRGRMVKARRSRLTAGRTTRSSLSRPKFRTRLRAPRNRKVSIKRVRLTA